MDKYKIDSHKLNYHIDRLNDWVNNAVVYPIYLEVTPTSLCNHRCSFCAIDFLEYKKNFLNTDIFLDFLTEISESGIKSIMYAGEGEPLIHKQIDQIILSTKQHGIDVALTTNGVFLSRSLSEKIINSVNWIKVSINAGTDKTYAQIHRTKKQDFEIVINNLRNATKIRESNHSSCVLGMQMILLPENQNEAITLARIAKDIGVDYVVFKPYSQHYFSKTTQYENINYEHYYEMAEDLEKLNDSNFNVIFRLNTMKRWDKQSKDYDRCLALPFWSYIDAKGNVWGCSAFLGNEKFRFGNIYKNSFKEIWEGEKRKELLQWVENDLNIEKCRVNCRMNNVNYFLWDLKHPPEHVNFI